MKVDRAKLKKSSSEVPSDCKTLIDKLKVQSENDLYKELRDIKVWTYGKCELYHWADVLDVFDTILEKSCSKENEKKWTLSCDIEGSEQLKKLLLEVLRFTALLIEHSFSRHLYNSMDHLTTLLTSCDMSIVLYVLNLLYVFSKRSNFIARMNIEKKQGVIQRLIHLAESWGGRENGFGLAECCQDLPTGSFPSSATTLHFEFYAETKDDQANKKVQPASSTVIQSIHMENVDKSGRMPSQIMEDILEVYDVPVEKQVLLFTHIRLACLFSNYEARVHCVQARLQAISILVYSSSIQDNMNVILYPGLIEELVDIVEIEDPALVDIKSAALRTLTSVIHIERNPRLNSIIDATGASSYHGFLPVLVRTCIQHMIDPDLKPFPQTYATSLFSFLYHLANYEHGVEALVSCGMMESLLKVINWYGDGQEHITFVTRAVRVIDLITNMDMAAFQAHGGLNAFINRLEHEVNICRKEQPFVIRPHGHDLSMDANPDSPLVVPMETSTHMEEGEGEASSASADAVASTSSGTTTPGAVDGGSSSFPKQTPAEDEGAAGSSGKDSVSSGNNVKALHCFAQRAALLKSMLNFLKKAIPDLSFAESIRHLMDGSLPKSLKHIISNAEYYGPSLFLLATDVVTVYVFQEPSLLSSLQDKGLTDVVLHALLIKDVPATREILASLPNVFSALCLNARGLEAFVVCKPFDSLFRVLLSPDYLPAMRRRRSSDPFGDTASNLGNAMDELMRHQPSLRADATKAIIKLLEEICIMGQDPLYICQKQPTKTDNTSTASSSSVRSPQSNEASSSDEEEEDEVEMPHMPPSFAAPAVHMAGPQAKPSSGPSTSQLGQTPERQAIPLMDYVLNVMKFVEAILSNNSTADHCREFVAQKGLKPLMSILGLPNLPIDFPSSAACQAVSSACKSVLTLSKEAEVLRGGLLQMKEVLDRLEPLHSPLEPPGGSVLLRELANAAHIPEATLSSSATPLLHALSAAHAYITMFVHVCRMGQFDIRTISVNHWGSDLGLSVLKGLSSLYNSLVWESTVLLALCNEDYLPSGCLFGKADLEKLLSKDAREKSEETMEEKDAGVPGSSDNGGADAMDTQNTLEEHMDTSESSPAHAAPAEAGNGSGLAQAQGPLVTPSASSTSIDSELLQQADSAGSGVGTSEVVGDDKENKRKLTPAMQAQLRQLKPLLTLSSRLGRALSELFVLLVKLCVGSPVRMRRSQQLHPPVMPSPPAREVALALTKLLAGGLSFQPPIDASLAKLRMTFLVCSVGFTAPMLFDEKKHPFHLMLQKFVNCGGQDALFQSFSWALSMDGKVPLAEGLEHPDLPDGTGEFLDSWLALVEKMINTKAVLESPHVLPAKGKSPGLSNFNPVQYLISTQKAAFNAVMNLWNKKPLPVHGSRMSESVFTILCHIIKGEAIIKKHLEKEKAGAVAIAGPSGAEAVDLSGAGPSGVIAAAAAGNRLAEPAINQAHLQQLMDMGFSREQATVALTNTNSVEQATEYILSNPMPAASSSLGGAMDLTGDENDENAQMTRAIAMSLGENFLPPDQAKTEQKSDKTDEDAEEKQEGEEPLDSAVLDDFTQNIFPGCLNLLDTLPETVYRVCDLLNVVMQRNGPDWQRETLGTLCKDLCGLSEEMTSFAQDMNLDAMQNSPSAQKFATRLHLLSLLAEEMNLSCSLAMQHVNLPGRLVSLLQSSHDPMLVIGQTAGFKSTPRWLAPMLVLLDLWEKIAISLRRKMEARIAVGANRIWKWFDDSSGRWCKYSSNNNQTIDDAYRKGDSMVRFQAGRRKYSVQFSTMVQLNEETGNRRPVMLSIQTAEDRTNGKKETKDTGADEQLIEEIKKEFEVPANTVHYLPCLPHESIEIIINCLSAFLSIPLNADTLQAAMRLILRMTRQHQYAVLFVSQGGARQLLKLTLDSNFQGFLNLATLIFRHILEEPVSLRYCMEKVMRNVCAGIGSCQSGVSQGGIGAQEMHYVLRVLGPAACRDPELFTQVARDTLQIALPGPADEDETRYTGPNAPQILKCTPTKQLEALVNPSIKTFIWDLLNSLIAEQPLKTKKSINQAASLTVDQIIEDAVSKVIGQTRQNVTSPATRGALPEAGQQNKESTVSVVGGQETTTTAAYPLIPKSAILRLLSEIIRSYGNCVQLITQYYYQPGQTELVPDGCSVLAFVLDSLLPSCQTVGDKDCPALSRVFVASISSCSHSPDAQMALVTEVKAALGRALALQEGSVKHHRVQALASIINTMIEACPSPGQVPNQVFKGQQVMNNNMIKSLVKKGVLVDLARIPHSLDLSSPFLATTINYVLKPLETLSRSVNSPDKFVSVKKVGGGSGAANGSSADQGTSGTVELDQGGTTTQVVTEPPNSVTVEDAPGAVTPMPDPGEVSEMNVTIEDVTNDPEAQANLEMSSDHHISEPQSSRQMNSLLSQLLGEAGGDPEDQVLSDITIDSGRRGIISRNEHRTGEEDNDILIDVEVEVEGDDDFEAHDSQMVSQVLSDEDDDADERHPRGHDDNQDDVSGDEEDYDEAYQEETGDDDEDEEDEEDEDEDEEDTSDMEGDGDEYQDTENLVMMEDFTNRASGLHRHIILNDTSQIQTYHLPVQLHDTETGSEAQPSLPPAPSTITSTHPLLMRQGDSHGNRSSHRGGPGGSGIRQRVRPFLPTGHANLGMSTRQPNTPVILQRLLGESTAAEILQLTSSFSSHNPGSGGPTRVLVSGDNIPIIQRPEDDLFEGLFQEPFGESSSSGSGALSCIPSTLTRWTEESKVLDGEGVHDLVTVLKPPLVEELVRRRDEELGNRKEERKKAIETAALDEKKKEAQGNTPLSTKPTNVTSSGEQVLATTGMRMSTSQGGGDEQSRSNQAEMLACAMVEQVFSPLVQSSGAASTQPETVTTSTVNAAGLPNLADSSLSTPVPTLPGFVQVELTPLSNPQDRSRLYNPAAAVSSSAPGEIFTPHIGGAGLHPTQPPPPIPQFSFLNSSSGAQAASLFQHQQLQVSGTAIPMAADPSLPSGSLASLYPLGTTAAQPAESQPLIFSQASPAALNTGLWTPMNTPNVTRGSETSATTNSSHHGSMISQLLDSIFSDQAFNPHSQHATSVTPSNPAAPLAPQPMVTPSNSAIPMPLPQAPVMPVRHIPWQPDAPVTGSPQRQLHLHNSQGSVNVGESGRMIGGATGMDTGVSMQQQPPLIPLSVATSGAPHNQELVYLNSMPVIPISGAPGPASATQFSSLDLAQDLSSIFPPAQQNVYGTSGSGVTGATPPLSNLNFVTTTAAASCNLVPTPLSRDGGSTVVATTTASTSTVAATSMTCSTQAAEAISIAAATASAISAPGTSSGSQDATDTEIPEGVDPSFLAALPEHIREEVILEQLRLQRIRRQAQEQSSTTATQGSGRSEAAAGEASNGSGEANTAQTMEVNPEFLAALPLAIQEEVLAQQRAEQARAQAAQQSAANPDMPVDPAIFFSTLSTTLRQQVLADMDDSMLAVLPPELAAEAQELRRDMEERHRRILQERLFAQAGFVNRLGSRYGLRGARRNPWLSGNSRLTAGAQGGTLGQSGKVKGRFMLDPEALTCLLVLLFIDEPKLNTSRLHRVLRNLCYHGPTRAWLIRALLSIVQRAGENNCSLSSATAAANSLCIEGTPAAAASATSSFKDKGKGKKSAQSATAIASSSTSFSSSSVTSIDSSMSMQSTEASSNVSSGHSQAASHQVSNPSSAAGGYWLSISLEAALGCRANVFQIHRTTGGKRHAGSSAASSGNINIHPQAAPVVCRHAFDTLISLAKVFPSYFLPAGKAKEVNKCEGDLGGKEEDSGDSTGRSNASNTGPQSSPKSSRPAGEGSTPSQPAKHELKPENDVWNILLRLDGASGKSKGKGVQRSHSASTSEFEHLAVDYNGSALGQLMLMLKHPVVRRCQLLTDRLLRLLGLISDSLPDNSGRAQPATTTGATTSVGLLTGRDIRRRLATPPPVAPSPAVPATTPAAAQGGAESTNEQVPSAAAAEGTTASKDTKKAEAASETESDEDENPILYEQLKLAVEVLTSKSCSEEGLEDATSLLLQLSWANSATRAAVLELLLSGARQLGLAVCSHIHSLLEQLKELNARLSVDQVVEEESSSGEAQGAAGLGLTSGQSGKGLLQDRFSNGASIVVSAPTKLKTGRELQLPSMSQLTSKTSGQQFFLRILKVILQLREAARSAGTKNKKSSTSTSRGRGGLGFEHIHAIIDSVVSDDELINFLGENPHTQPEIPALRHHHHQAQNNPPAQPPVSSATGTNQANLLGMSASTTANPSGSTTPGVEATDSRTQSSQSSSTSTEAPMEVDTQSATADNKDKKNEEDTPGQSASMSTSARLPRLSDQLSLEQLWTTLGDCLAELARTPDHHAVLILQPAVEAFFIVHAGEKDSKIGDQQQTTSKREDQLAHLNMEMAPPSPSPGPSSAGPEQPLTVLGRDNSGITMASITHLPPDTQKFLKFAETHRTVLNQILRQRTLPLAEGPFSVLVDYTRILDFDVKRRHFRQELERLNEGARREDLPVHVRRSNVFEDSFRELFRRTPEEWKQRFYIVFEGEEGQDAGGLLREWYIIISHEIFNQNYALFLTSPGDRVTYSINPSSHCNSNHLSYFKFVGRIIAKAVYDNKLLDCYFTRSFYKHMLGLAVKYTDMESEDYAFYQGLVFLLENSVEDLGYDLFFSTEIQEFGVTETRELVPNGSNTLVTNENKREYVKLVCQMKMTGAIRQQLNAFLEGFYDIIPKKLVSIFTEQELELLISGLPTIDIDELKANTEYHKYQATSLQIQWFWRALRSFDQAERANFLQFVTGTSKVPLGGFGNLEGMNGTQKFQIHRDDRSTDRLPSAHTCFNQLDLPAYETYDKLRKMLLLAISECSEGFGLA